MRMLKTLTMLSAPALMLAACGSSDDASTEASADTVEMPADSALAPVNDAPVADPTATVTESVTATPEPTTTEAADAAADVAAKAAAAAEEEPVPAQ